MINETNELFIPPDYGLPKRRRDNDKTNVIYISLGGSYRGCKREIVAALTPQENLFLGEQIRISKGALSNNETGGESLNPESQRLDNGTGIISVLDNNFGDSRGRRGKFNSLKG